jgi:hypothetical protein
MNGLTRCDEPAGIIIGPITLMPPHASPFANPLAPPVLATPGAADLLCRQNESTMRRRPRPWLATSGGDLTSPNLIERFGNDHL